MATTYRTGDRVQIQAPISRSPLGSAVIIEQGKKNPEIFHVRQEWDNRTGWVHIGRMHPATEESPVIADAAMDNGRCQPTTYNVTVCNERGEHVFSTVWTFKATDAAAVAAQQRLLVSRSHRLIAHHGAHHVVIGGNGTIRTITANTDVPAHEWPCRLCGKECRPSWSVCPTCHASTLEDRRAAWFNGNTI